MIEVEGSTVTFDPIGCATPRTPASARLEIANATEADIDYPYEVTGTAGIVASGVLPVPAGDSAATFLDEIAAGTYTITVTPDGGTPLVDSVDVAACPPPTTVALSLVDPGCAFVGTDDPLTGRGTATVTNQSSSIVVYDVTLASRDGELTEQIELRGGDSIEIPLDGLRPDTYTLTVTTTDLTDAVVGTWTAADTLVACVVEPFAEGESTGCFETVWYFDTFDSDVPVTFTFLAGHDGTSTELTGVRLDEITLEPGDEGELVTRSERSYPSTTVMATAQGDTIALFTVQNADYCLLAPAPITVTAACGVVTFANPADNATVFVSYSAVDLEAEFDESAVEALVLRPGTDQVLMTKADFLFWVSTLDPIDLDTASVDDPRLLDSGFLFDLVDGTCPPPPAGPADPTASGEPANPAPANPAALPGAAAAIAETGAAEGLNGLAGFGLLALCAGSVLLGQARRRSALR